MPRGPAEMPFLDHLEELRWRILWSLAALVVGGVVGFFLVKELGVLGILERPIRDLLPPGQKLAYTNPTTPFLITLKLALLVGLLLALPVIVYQAWAFLSPALYDRERRYVVPSSVAAVVLFGLGVAMAYFLVLPFGLRFLLGFQAEALTPIITIDEYLRFTVTILLAFGLVFEMPILLVVLGLLGVVTPEKLRRGRRYAVVVLATISALLTPADVGTMAMMLVPMLLLYEISIWLVRLLAPDREAGTELAGRGGTPA